MASVHPRYIGMKFPDYVYQEYPKWVTGNDKKTRKLVQDKAEELRFIADFGVMKTKEQEEKDAFVKVLEEERQARMKAEKELAELKAAKAK